MLYRVRHRTAYRYANDIVLSHHQLHLTPRVTPNQFLERHCLALDPKPETLTHAWDVFDNAIQTFSMDQPHRKAEIIAESEIQVRELTNIPQLLTDSTPWQEVVHALRFNGLAEAQYVYPSPLIDWSNPLRDYAADLFTAENLPVYQLAERLMQRVYAEFDYAPGMTNLSTRPEQALAQKNGVCQDFAHVAIAVLRAHGLAAAYISGYLETEPPPGQEKLEGADASHAWFSVFDPKLGWLGFDPTNNQIVNGRHILIARGRDYTDVSPVKGIIYGGGANQMLVEVDVRRIDGEE